MLSVEFSFDASPLPRCAPSPGYMRHGVASKGLNECSAEIDVFLVDLKNYPWQSRQSWLSEEEGLRASKFRFEHDRRRFRAAHCALREVLGSCLTRHPGSLKFLAGEHGKPSIDERDYDTPAGYGFNLSHSADLAFIGIAAQLHVGVDIEQVRAISELRSLAEEHLTKPELQELLSEPEHRRDRCFLQGWTRKEACLKAVGSGLSIAPASFHTGLSDGPFAAVIESVHGQLTIHVRSVDVGPDAVAALAWLEPQDDDFQST